MEKTFNIYEFVNRRNITRIAYATIVEHENYVYCKYFEVNKDSLIPFELSLDTYKVPVSVGNVALEEPEVLAN